MQKLVFVADLGRLKAFRLEESPRFSHPRMKLVEDWETNVTQHLSEELTDQAGQFRKGPKSAEGPGALSDGEQHNLDLERRRRAVRTLAQRINTLVEREDGVDACYLAADSRINQQLLDEMQQRTRAKIQKNVPANLSKLSPDEVLAHFEK